MTTFTEETKQKLIVAIRVMEAEIDRLKIENQELKDQIFLMGQKQQHGCLDAFCAVCDA